MWFMIEFVILGFLGFCLDFFVKYSINIGFISIREKYMKNKIVKFIFKLRKICCIFGD